MVSVMVRHKNWHYGERYLKLKTLSISKAYFDYSQDYCKTRSCNLALECKFAMATWKVNTFLHSVLLLMILCLWYKEYVFIQPNGISTTLQRENHGNEWLKIHMFHQKLRWLLNDFSYLIAAFRKYNNIDTLTFSETHISCDSYNDRDELYVPGYTFARESHKIGQNGDKI